MPRRLGEISSRGQEADTLTINVHGQQMKFYEHRVDDGYNNWFTEQYLIAVTTEKQPKIRLESSKIDSLTTDRIYVISALGYYYNESPIDTITVVKHSYAKSNVAKVLVKN